MKIKLIIALVLLSVSIVATANTKNDGRKVTGKVYEMVDGKQKPLPMAFVYANSSDACSHSDFDGKFEIDLPKNSKELSVSFKGYTQKSIALNKKTNEVSIVLSKDIDLVTEK